MFGELLVAFIVVLGTYTFLTRRKNYPPGPLGLPILGNILQVGGLMHLVFQKWGQTYGKLFSIRLGFEHAVILDDHKLMKEMFADPAFSGKPQNDIFLYLTQGHYGILNTEGKIWEAQRRFTIKHLRDFGFGKNYMEGLIMDEVKDYIDWLKKEEGNPVSVSRKFTLATLNSLWTICSGKRFAQDDPKLTNMMDTARNAFNSASETGLLLFAPWIRHVAPVMSGWTKIKNIIHELISFQEDTVNEHKAAFVDGDVRDFVDNYLSEMNKTTDPDSSFYGTDGYKHLVAVIGDLFQAGSETTSSTLSWAVLYLTLHQSVQEKLQEEIDRVVGKSRSPCLADRPMMPYTEAVIMEILRKSSIIPTGVFHRAMMDKEFNGYMIPKGTWIIPNLYSTHHNPTIWGDPENFRPERFMSPDGKTAKKHEALVAFQSGKRQCLGEPLARDTIFLFLTSIFQQFQIRPDPNGPSLSMEPAVGFILQPKQFHVVMKDRISN